MKKLFKITYIIFAIGLIIGAVCFTSAASSEAGAIWQVTHADGKVDYYNDFAEAFNTLSEGDVFKLLPEEYELSYTDSKNHDFATISTTVNITVDLRGSTIFCNATGDVAAQFFNISSSNGSTVRVLMENTVIYVPSGARTAFTAAGSAVVEIDGGEAGGKIFAPGALNLIGNYSNDSIYSYMKNIYCYKTSKNMAGMICSRGTTKLKLIDTYAVGLEGYNPPIYIVDEGEIIMENSVGISIGGGDIVKFSNSKSGASLTLGKGTMLYGKVSGITDACGIILEEDTFFTHDLSAYVTGYTDCISGQFSLSYTYYTSSTIGSYNTSNVSISYTYRVIPSYTMKDEYEPGLMWRLEDNEGNVKYSSSLVPVIDDTEGKYICITLLEDITASNGIVLNISGDIKIDLSGRKITSADPAVSFKFITVSGSGSLTLDMNNAVIDLGRATFLNVLSLRKTSVSAAGAYAGALHVIVSDATDVSVEGGSYTAASGCAFLVKNASLVIKELTVYGASLSCDEDVTVFEGVRLLPPLGQTALTSGGSVALSDGTLISGSLEAKALFMDGTVRLGGSPVTESSNMLVIEDRIQITVPVLEMSNGVLQNVNKSYTFKYRSANINENIHFNFEFRSFVALNVYIPKGIVEANKDFALRLSVSGLLLDADKTDASDANIEGRTYKRFTYRYIYPTSYYDDVNLTLISGSFSYTSSAHLSDLLERSFAAADDSVKAIIATYAAYALDISASSLPADSPMTEHVREFKAEERITDQIAKYISYVRYDVPNQRLILTPRQGLSGTMLLVYGFGDEQLRYNFPLNGEMSVPVYRLNNGKAISAAVAISGGTERFMFDIYTLIAFMPEDSSSRHDLELYAAYLASVQAAISD